MLCSQMMLIYSSFFSTLDFLKPLCGMHLTEVGTSGLLRRLLDTAPPLESRSALRAAHVPSTTSRTAVAVARFRRRVTKRRGFDNAMGGAVRLEVLEQRR